MRSYTRNWYKGHVYKKCTKAHAIKTARFQGKTLENQRFFCFFVLFSTGGFKAWCPKETCHPFGAGDAFLMTGPQLMDTSNPFYSRIVQ